jgi:hypothetical protein
MKENWSIALYIGLGMWALAALLVVRIQRLRSKGLLVQGLIIRHENQKISFRDRTFLSPYLVVRFTSPLAGEIECRIMGSTHLPRFQVGQRIYVSYDPEKPEEFGRSIDQLLLPPFLLVFFGCLPLIVYVAKALGF